MRKELKAVNAKLRPIQAGLAKLGEAICKMFRSRTVYKKEKKSVPFPSITTTLESYWGPYVGICEYDEGKRLLAEKERLSQELESLNAQRDAILRPFRQKLYEKTYAKEMAEYQKQVAEYERALEEYQRNVGAYKERKEQWQASNEREVVPVGSVEPRLVNQESDLGKEFPRWGVGKNRDKSWRFFCTNEKTQKGKLRVFCERPKAFPEWEPNPPWNPQEPVRRVVE